MFVSLIASKILTPDTSSLASALRQNFAIVDLSTSKSLATFVRIPHFKPVLVVGSMFDDNRTKIKCLCPVVNSFVLGAISQKLEIQISSKPSWRLNKVSVFFDTSESSISCEICIFEYLKYT